jgi:nitrite reductase/ring-hydroxylating ferredoxin subunit
MTAEQSGLGAGADRRPPRLAATSDIATGSVEMAPRRIQALVDQEPGTVPWQLRAASFAELGHQPLSIERYVSREWHDREVEKMWKRVWQVACREEEIPAVGDSIIYEIADSSLIVVRTGPDSVRAFHNSCLHRGRLLRDQGGCVAELRCPFHGFTWDLDGQLTEIPSAWDFGYINRANYRLPEARVTCWDGWVFICMDHEAAPLQDYLGDFSEHWSRWPSAGRTTNLHIVKHLKCNWKVSLDAFIESFHVIATHPQLLVSLDDVNTQYDTYEGQPSFNRMISAQAVSSPHLGKPVSEQEIIDSLLSEGRGRPELSAEQTARDVLASVVKRDYSLAAGEEIDCTISEAIDAIQYYVFPNFVPWAGLSPIVYRFRPAGNDPEASIMDIWLLQHDPSEPRRRPPPPVVLDSDTPFSSVLQLGRLALIFDQDMANLGPVQRGLRASVRPAVSLATYQESRIRHYSTTLDRYLES